MSLLSKLNPWRWIKEALISDYVGGWLRHGLTALGSIMLMHKLGSTELVLNWVDATIALVTDSTFLQGVLEILTGLGAIAGGIAASVTNKKVP